MFLWGPGDLGITQCLECLLSMYKALDVIPSTSPHPPKHSYSLPPDCRASGSWLTGMATLVQRG